MAEFYFRYDGYEYANCEKYEVIKRTPKGAWINLGYAWEKDPKKKFILDNARRRWAYPTVELALNSFRIRKERQIRHCNDMIENANIALLKVGFKAIDPASRFNQHFEESW